MPEWLKGTDCKSVGYAYVGSNPTSSTTTIRMPRRSGAFSPWGEFQENLPFDLDASALRRAFSCFLQARQRRFASAALVRAAWSVLRISLRRSIKIPGISYCFARWCAWPCRAGEYDPGAAFNRPAASLANAQEAAGRGGEQTRSTIFGNRVQIVLTSAKEFTSSTCVAGIAQW